MTTPPNLSLVPGVYNFRDVGGLPAASGETRSRVLYRSGSLAHLGDEGRATITSLRLRRVIDLRDNAEVGRDYGSPTEYLRAGGLSDRSEERRVGKARRRRSSMKT